MHYINHAAANVFNTSAELYGTAIKSNFGSGYSVLKWSEKYLAALIVT